MDRRDRTVEDVRGTEMDRTNEPPEGGTLLKNSSYAAPASLGVPATSEAMGRRVSMPRAQVISSPDMTSQMPALLTEVAGERLPLFPSPEALEAIRHEQGPALVLAAPGSGKAFVITERYLRLLRDHHLTPDRVLILTYDNQAAVRLRDRVRDGSSRKALTPARSPPTTPSRSGCSAASAGIGGGHRPTSSTTPSRICSSWTCSSSSHRRRSTTRPTRSTRCGACAR